MYVCVRMCLCTCVLLPWQSLGPSRCSSPPYCCTSPPGPPCPPAWLRPASGSATEAASADSSGTANTIAREKTRLRPGRSVDGTGFPRFDILVLESAELWKVWESCGRTGSQLRTDFGGSGNLNEAALVCLPLTSCSGYYLMGIKEVSVSPKINYEAHQMPLAIPA